MTEKDAMLKDVAQKAALVIIGVAVLSPALTASVRKRVVGRRCDPKCWSPLRGWSST